MITYLLVREGQIETAQHEDLSIEELQRLVGGYVQAAVQIPADDGGTIFLYCNEDGKMMGLPWNFYMSRLRDMIVGPLVIAACDDEGVTRSLFPEEAARFTTARVSNLNLLRYEGLPI